MSGIKITNSNRSAGIETSKKVIEPPKNEEKETKSKVKSISDSLKLNQTKTSEIPITTSEIKDISLPKKVINRTKEKIKDKVEKIYVEDEERPTIKSVMLEGAKTKGLFYGAQYAAMGAAHGHGFRWKFLNSIPEVAKNVKGSTLSRTMKAGGKSGAYGGAIGVAKGLADGLVVGLAPNRETAIAGVATTSVLASLPTLKFTKAIPGKWGKIMTAANLLSGAVMGGSYGYYLYESTRK